MYERAAFGQLLICFRKKFLISQDRCAKVLGVKKSTISHWETGYRQPSEPIRRLIYSLMKTPSVQADEFLARFIEAGQSGEVTLDNSM